jgi:excisionase family DNA binding protein
LITIFPVSGNLPCPEPLTPFFRSASTTCEKCGLKAASEYLGLPPRSVYKLIRDGKIPRVKLSEDARRVLVDVADLDRAIDRAKQLAL